MAKSTFSGPLRSEDTFKTVSKNSSTGAITEIITMGDGPVTLGDEDSTLTNATHSGRLIVVPAITANRTITLPSPVAGSHFKFIYGGAAEETENLIFDTGADANYFIGGVVHAILDLLYSWFFVRALWDLCFMNIDDPFHNLFSQ